jgi:hypothetical protein
MRPTHAPVDVLPPLRQVSRRLQRAQLRRRREVVPQQRRVCWRAERRELHGARVVRERLHAHHLAARRLDQLQRVGLLVVHTHSVAAGAGRVRVCVCVGGEDSSPGTAGFMPVGV